MQFTVRVCARKYASQVHSHTRADRTNLPSQPSTAVTHCTLIATNLPTPEGRTVWLTVPAPGFEPGSVRLVVQ